MQIAVVPDPEEWFSVANKRGLQQLYLNYYNEVRTAVPVQASALPLPLHGQLPPFHEQQWQCLEWLLHAINSTLAQCSGRNDLVHVTAML